jgi:hypothetical protein
VVHALEDLTSAVDEWDDGLLDEDEEEDDPVIQ